MIFLNFVYSDTGRSCLEQEKWSIVRYCRQKRKAYSALESSISSHTERNAAALAESIGDSVFSNVTSATIVYFVSCVNLRERCDRAVPGVPM